MIDDPLRDDIGQGAEPDPSGFHAAVRDLTDAPVDLVEAGILLERLVHGGLGALGADGSAVMLRDDRGGLRCAAASAPDVSDIEMSQQDAGVGAGYAAFAANRSIGIDDVRHVGQRWPAYVHHLERSGYHAVLAVPLNAYGQTVGVFDVYRVRPLAWSRDDRARAEVLAALGAGYIMHANTLRAQHDLAENLERIIESRDLIGQAKGVLMARLETDAATALSHLRRLARHHDRGVHDIASQITTGGIGDLDLDAVVGGGIDADR